jgi:serine/threonine protein kinase/tetratricopeptide (TPR) repeat protein
MSEPIGKLIAGRYRIESVLGTGGVGTVYRAIQDTLQRPVALKMLHPELSGNPTVRRRFSREARAVASLSHPNIAAIYDYGTTDDGTAFLAMEYIEGTSLADLVVRDEPAFPVLREIFDQILSGLGHAHARGVIHRDIKPANILVSNDPDGAVLAKIVDFGIATGARFEFGGDNDSTGAGSVVGTPHFMAPEQARGERHLSATVDVYTVGLMLFWAITGQHAFHGETPIDVMMAQISAPTPPVVPRPGVVLPEGVEAMIHAALQKSPRDRIPSATAFRARLRTLSGGATVAITDAVPKPPPPPPGRATPARPRTILESDLQTVHEVSDELLLEPEVASSGRVALRIPNGVVGRAADRERMILAGHRAFDDGHGVIITLEGEAGLGKSTMARWFAENMLEHYEVRVGTGTFHRDGDRGLRGFREAFDVLLDTRGLDADRLDRALRERLVGTGFGDARDLDMLRTFLRPSMAVAERSAPPTGDGLYEVLFRLLESQSKTRPLLVVVDDVHWAGPETAGFIQYLGTELAQRRCHVVVLLSVQVDDITTEELGDSLRELARHEGNSALRLRLGTIPDDDARALVAAMLDASPELKDALVQRASGNPMHLVQLIRFLSEEGHLEQSSSGWRTRAGIDVTQVLPPGLADIVEARIRQVENHPRHGDRLHRLLDRVAILGRSSRFSILERMLRAENEAELIEHLDEDIDELLDEELLAMTETRDDDILSFPNSLTRDVILSRLRNRRTTRRLHQFAAEAKLAVLGVDSDKAAAELADHFAAARDLPREFEYTRIAAEVADRSHRPHDAERHFLRALALLDDLGDESVGGRETRRVLRLRLAGLSVGFGNYDVARQHFSAILEDPEAPARSRVRAAYGSADIAWIRGEFDTALTFYTDGVAQARVVEDAQLVSTGLIGLARVHSHRGEGEIAASLVADALEQAGASQDPAQAAEVLWFQGDIASGRGDVENAERHLLAALERFSSLDRPLGVAKCRAKLAMLARMRNDLDLAVENYSAALEIYRAHGGRRGVAHQLNGLGDVARFRGDLKLATEHYRRAVDIFESLQLPYDAAIALTNLGLAARQAGNLDEAREAMERALRVSERVHYAYLTLGIKLNLAYVLALLGEEAASNELLEQALALSDDVELVDPDYALPLEMLGDLKAASGRGSEAGVLYERAWEMWKDLGRTADLERIEARRRAPAP